MKVVEYKDIQHPKVVKGNLYQILDYEIEINGDEFVSIKELINYYKNYTHMTVKQHQTKPMDYQQYY